MAVSSGSAKPPTAALGTVTETHVKEKEAPVLLSFRSSVAVAQSQEKGLTFN